MERNRVEIMNEREDVVELAVDLPPLDVVLAVIRVIRELRDLVIAVRELLKLVRE